MARWLGFGLLALAFVVFSGCSRGPSGTGIVVKGTLLQNGKPLQPAPKEDDTVTIQFLPPDPKNNPGETVARYNHADGTFEIKGPVDAGVVPGDYRVSVSFSRYEGGDDVFNDQFSQEKSTLKYTVTSDKEQEIVIDVGKRTVTKVR